MRPIDLLCTLWLVGIAACTPRQAVPVFDGSWWESHDYAAREAFVSGYPDCYVWNSTERIYSDAPIARQVDEVGKYYTSGPHRAAIIGEVVRKLGSKHDSVPSGERHGGYNGDFWRQCSSRLAFVEG